uniref:N-acetyltransferase domain-containing protein n=1 Tax=Chromera velia CCMP2878 TaxID=1169474 RepID=A0A0G4GIL9_9ALVE|mmetsp:Transcript_29007/g.56793  ORF Transcript_29007/g.56793 Transcript_29007/m.56793 type:complete len:337 (+) Transcript_29007:146-1156(+)|eukprot:Cvel_4763.t1-p1 / transcript=Cvel_4763.t1 / gene=Cvel_4763 / organism=Chromera_velia_CCMP2878 / gene_product=Uncharacterized N-acetyltransferase YjgM, putative / transcript_product=Uncharacterized N-acetyltransferase YjgM, putative / location=Cvel_scaffold212:75772-77402(+) / protein_length=336 / sequence_SO=supercontig / SO=protein_coding / is_pseudo=false
MLRSTSFPLCMFSLLLALGALCSASSGLSKSFGFVPGSLSFLPRSRFASQSRLARETPASILQDSPFDFFSGLLQKKEEETVERGVSGGTARGLQYDIESLVVDKVEFLAYWLAAYAHGPSLRSFALERLMTENANTLDVGSGSFLSKFIKPQTNNVVYVVKERDYVYKKEDDIMTKTNPEVFRQEANNPKYFAVREIISEQTDTLGLIQVAKETLNLFSAIAPSGAVWRYAEQNGGGSSEKDKVVLISDLFVVPRARRQGIAQTLVTVAEDKAKEWGFSRVFLQVNKESAPAMRLYEKLGYQRIGEDETSITVASERTNQVTEKDVTAVAMMKEL